MIMMDAQTIVNVAVRENAASVEFNIALIV